MYGTGRGRARCAKIHLSRYYDFARRLIFGSALILDGFKVADKARQRDARAIESHLANKSKGGAELWLVTQAPACGSAAVPETGLRLGFWPIRHFPAYVRLL